MDHEPNDPTSWPEGFDDHVDGVFYAPHEAVTIKLKLHPHIHAQVAQQTADGDVARHILSLIMSDLENPNHER